jgi:hypothetical protein
MCKATDREKGDPRASFNWVLSKRSTLKFYDDHIECGNWNFPNAEISGAILFRTKTYFFNTPVLQFDYKDKTYQFGLNPWAKPEKYLKVNFNEEYTKLKYSKFSLGIRIFILGYILWLILKNHI